MNYKLFCTAISFFVLCLCEAQKNSFIITSFFQYDTYPAIDDYAGRSRPCELTLTGCAFGLNVNYARNFKQHWNVEFGLGYQQYSFRVKDYFDPALNLTGHRRPIGVMRPVYIIYTSDKYWYDALLGSISINRFFPLKNGYALFTGLTYEKSYSFKQYYHVVQDNVVEKSSNFRPLSSSGNLSFGCRKNCKIFYADLALSTPIFTSYHADPIFFAGSNETHSKRFRGLRIALSIGINF